MAKEKYIRKIFSQNSNTEVFVQALGIKTLINIIDIISIDITGEGGYNMVHFLESMML